MTTIAHDLDDVQRFLKDAPAAGQDGVTWTRAELLSYYQDGYRDLVAQPQATRRFSVLDVPPRFTYSGTQRFEQRYASGGTFFPCTHGASSGSGWTSSSLFEVELVEGYTSTSASEGLTHPWERAYVSPAYTPFRFGVHRAHRRIGKLWYDNRLLQPVTVRELDRMDTNWISLAGEPVAWTLGTGDTSSLEVFEVATTYSATYATSGEGMLRYLSGARTYTAAYDGHAPTNASFAYSTSGEARALELTQLLSGFGAGLTQPAVNGYQGVHVWEYQMLASLSQTDDTTAIPCFAWEAPWSQTVQYAMGAVRALSSPDRQYWPVVEWADQVPLGKIDRLQSSENALLLLGVIEPDAPALTEQDTPGMLPPQLQKYLKYYVLARAWNRQGEGFQPLLAAFCLQMFARGARLMRTLGFLARRDAPYARQPVSVRGRPPRVRLPSSYPRVWR